MPKIKLNWLWIGHNDFDGKCQYYIELNLRRRELMQPDFNAHQRLCASSVPITRLLFGDDLTKEVKDINANNKVGNKMLWL